MVVDRDGHAEEICRALAAAEAIEVVAVTAANQLWEQLDGSGPGFDIAFVNDLLPEAVGAEPVPCGLPLLRRLKARSPDTEVIFLTGGNSGSGSAALEAGAFHYFERPFAHPNEFSLYARRAAELRALRQSARDSVRRREPAGARRPSTARGERRERLQRLRRLSEAARKIMEDLVGIGLEERLQRIAEHTTRILNAESCGVFLVEKPGFLTLTASYGHREGGFNKGLELAIHGGEQKGLTGWIAFHGKLFKSHGEKLKNHPAAHSRMSDHTPSGDCHSLVAIPLKRRLKPGEPRLAGILGLLRVDNKKGPDGCALPSLRFSQEDGWILRIFAEQVVVALQSAQLVRNLKEQESYKSRLVDSSPHGIIAIDRRGKVTGFNKSAEDTLGHRQQDVLGKPVFDLYADPQSPRDIGEELDKRDGTLSDYDSAVRHRDGYAIPIKISATWLLDGDGNQVGSAGYFQDLRSKQRMEERQQLLILASDLVLQAEDLSEGLQKLAEMIVKHLPHSFCRIHLQNEGDRYPLVEAAYRAPGFSGGGHWDPLLGEPFLLGWKGLNKRLQKGKPVLISGAERRLQPVLAQWTVDLDLDLPLQSLLLVPSTVNGRLVALLEIGELGKDRFLTEERELAAAIAAQTAVLIDRIRLHRETERQRQGLERANRLAKVVSDIMVLGEGESSHTLGAMLSDPSHVLGCDEVVIHLLDSADRRLLHLASPEDEDLANSALVRRVLHRPDPLYIEEDTERDPDFSFIRRRRARSLVALPLRIAREPIGILFLLYSNPHRLTGTEQSSLEIFANHVANTIHNARLYEQAKRRQEALNALYEASLDRENTLTAIAQQAPRVAPGTGLGRCLSYLTLVDGKTLRVISASSKELLAELQEKVGQHDLVARNCLGIVDRAVLSGKTQNVRRVDDDPNYVPILLGTRCQLSVPLKNRGEVMGVLTLEHESYCAFSSDDVQNLEALAVQATAALQHNEELEALHKAARAMSRTLGLPELRNRIVVLAREMFGANSAVLWPYDSGFGEFILEGMVAVGISPAEQEKAKELPPDERNTRYTALERGWIGAPDLDSEIPPYLGPAARGFMQRNGIRSFQAVAMRTGEEHLGVLFLNYDHARELPEKERKQLRNFATYAALCLKNAWVMEQEARVRLISTISSKVSIVGEVSYEVVVRALANLTYIAIGCQVVRLYLREPNSESYYCYFTKKRRSESGYTLMRVPVRGDDIFHSVFKSQKVVYLDRAHHPNFSFAWPNVAVERLKAWIAVPVQNRGKPFGVFFVGFTGQQHFTRFEVESVELLANQASVALVNNQLYPQAQKRLDVLNALYESGRAIAERSGMRDTLKEIASQALRIVGTKSGEESSFTYVALLEGSMFKLETAFPTERESGLRKEISKIDLTRREGKIGIVGQAVQKGRTQNEGNARKNRTYISLDENIRSQLVVPLLINNEVLGVISVEKPTVDAFSSEDIQNLELLAAQASVAIQSARRFSELQDVKGLVGTRTALVWINLMSAAWRHDIENDAITIRDEADWLQKHPDVGVSDLEERLIKIYNLAEQISLRPITPPLESEEGRTSLRLNETVRDWADRFRPHHRYENIEIIFKPQSDEALAIHASAEWLRRAFDYLMSNAAEAVSRQLDKRIVVVTRQDSGKAVISVIDNGPGIPLEIRDSLFTRPIKKPGRTQGLGVGLLLAQVIVQAHKGDVECTDPGPGGTTMTISLPFET